MVTKLKNRQLALLLFNVLGYGAIIAGGLLAAFSASNPTKLTAWASAYLVLVVGLLQIGFSYSLKHLLQKSAQKNIVWAFVIYNLGNAGVLLGTALKNDSSHVSWLINAGGILLTVAMLIFIYIARVGKRSWQLTLFYVMTIIILISVPIGLILARN